jgi:hypothetical protein
LAVVKSRVYTDFEMTGKVKSPVGADPYTVHASDLNFVLGWTDNTHYIEVMFNSNPGWSDVFVIANNNPVGASLQNAADYYLMSTYNVLPGTGAVLQDSAWHDFRVRRVGQVLDVWFDTLHLYHLDTSAVATPGAVGIGGYNDPSFWDDIEITDNPSRIEDPATQAQPEWALQVSQNPFKTAVSFELRAASKVETPHLYIYTTSGKSVARLTAHRSPLTASYSWNAAGMPAGVYFAKLKTGRQALSKRLLLMK